MPPRKNSRHLYSTVQTRDADTPGLPVFLSDRVPFRYRSLGGNRVITAKSGDTLHRIAAKVYAPLGQLPAISAASLWWVIADFQPIPIHDPTLQLVAGEKIIVPSLRTVIEQVLQRPRDV